MERNHTEMRESKKERSQSKSRGDVDGEDGGEELNEEKQSEHTTRLTLLTHSEYFFHSSYVHLCVTLFT